MSQTTRPAQQGRSGRQGDKPRRPRREPVVTVSYTHLTLPTKA